jgi:glutamine amidotransferase PdxT
MPAMFIRAPRIRRVAAFVELLGTGGQAYRAAERRRGRDVPPG